MTQVSLHIGAEAKIPKKQEKKTNKLRQYLAKVNFKTFIQDANAFLATLTKVKTSDKVSFFRLLATMINAGMTIVKSLRVLSDQNENAKMKQIIGEIADKIEAGASFSDAVKDYDDVFSSAQIGMIEAGEASGRLNDTLLQVAAEAEKSASIASKIRGAMIYPSVVIFLLFAAGIAIMVFVMPKIKEMFDQLGGNLPGVTKALIASSDFLVGTSLGITNVFWLIIIVAGLIFGLISWKKTPVGSFLWAQGMLRFPVFGKLVQKVALARFARGLSTLNGSGVPIIKALRITADSVGNPVYQKRINQIADDVKQGITMAENMRDDERHFPQMVVGMINVAEQTAQIDAVTGKIADFYEDEVDDMVRNLSSLMEPIIIVVLGIAVGFLVISVMLPILQSSDLAFSSI